MDIKLPTPAVAMCWFGRDDYARLLEICEDAANLHANYDDWLESFEKGEQTLIKDGIRVIRILANPDDLAAWCVSMKCKVNAQARIRFAISRANEIALGRNN